MKSFLILMLTFLVIACAPVQVNYDYDKAVDFSQYGTYNYFKDMETGLSALDTKRLLDALDTSLKVKGLNLSENPDILINIKSSEFQNNNRNTVGVGLGGGGRNVGGGISIGIPVGKSNISRLITFDFVDEKKDELIWQAKSESSFSENASPEKREEKLKQVTDKVLSQYPPEK